MARRAGGGSTIVGPKDVTPEQEQARLDESLAALRATAAKGQAERDKMDEVIGATEGPLDLPSEQVTEQLTQETEAAKILPQIEIPATPDVSEDNTLAELSARQREAERVPGLFERTGIPPQSGTTRLKGAEDAFGLEMIDRLEVFVDTVSNQLDPVSLPISRATDMDPNNPLFDDQLEKFNADDPEQTLRMNKGEGALALTKSNVLLSRQGLGIGKWNPDWNPAEVDIDSNGKLTNYNDLTTVQPAIIDPVYGIGLASVIEPFLLQQEAMDAIAVLDEDQGGRPKGESQDFSMQAGGRELFKGLRKMRSEIEGEPSDSYVTDYENFTPEAFELIFKWGLDTYAQANPEMVTITPGRKGEATRGYTLTSKGMDRLGREVDKYRPVDFDYPLMVETSPEGTFQYEQRTARGSTGQNPNKDPSIVEEAKYNAHQVNVVFDNQRTKIATLFGAHAIATAPVEGRQQGTNFTLDAFDIGPQRYLKIKGIAAKQKSLVEKYEIDREEVKARIAENPLPFLYAKLDRLNENIKFREELVEKYSKPEVIKQLYYQHANKNLEVLVNLAKYDGDTFHYSYFNQQATQRLTTHQNKMSFQNNHLVRNVVGSGVKYDVRPMSGSPNEVSFLENMGYLFFDGAGFIPQAATNKARQHITQRSPRYKRLVSIGSKLKDALDNYNPEVTKGQFKNVKVTPKGISGVDGIKATMPEPIMNDTEVKSFLDAMSAERDSHKHFVQIIDYLVDLAKYDEAMKAGKSFHTSINSIEIDGISNGIASMFAALGLESKLYRVGVKRAAGQEKILGNFKDIPNRDAYEGNIRATLQQNLQEFLSDDLGVLYDSAWMRKYGYNETQVAMLQDIIKIASDDRNETTFKKMPLMTFSYGQELSNLIDSVYDTILGDPQLKALIENEFPGGIPKAAEFLNDFRNLAIELTLGSEVTNFASSLKRFVEVSAIYNRPVVLDSAAGGKISFGGFITKDDPTKKQYATRPAPPIDKGGRQISRKKLEDQIKKVKTPKQKEALQRQLDRLPPETKVVIKPKVSTFSPHAEKQGMIGARARGAILIAFGQGFDGATMLNVFAGKNWNNITKQNGGRTPFILPIYDAIVTDLGSMQASRQAINNSWVELTTNGKVLKSLQDNVTGNVVYGRKEFKRMAEESPKKLIDQEEHGMLVRYIASKLIRLTSADPDLKEVGRDLRQELLGEGATYLDLFAAQEFLLKNEYELGDTIPAQVSKLVRNANERSRKVSHDIQKDYDIMGTEAEVLQYAAADLKLSKVLKTFDEG
jgi:hypothetical protein